MNTGHPLAAGDTGFPVFAVFAAFVSCSLFLAILTTSHKITSGDFYVSNGKLSPAQNGIALFGDSVSAGLLLGAPGLIALTGYDGIPAFVLGPIAASVVLLLLVAEPYHSTGRYTVGDCLARRLRPSAVHAAAGIATLPICLLYLIAQLVGAGALAGPILGLTSPGAQKVMVASLGVLMILYVVIGGMRATTLVQLVKAVLLIGGGLAMAFMVMAEVGWHPGNLLQRAAERSGLGVHFLEPGRSFGDDGARKLDSVSQQVAILLGAAGLPHVLMRLGAVPNARAARSSVQWAVLLIMAFCLTAVVLGFGAAALVGPDAISSDNPSGNTATLLLAEIVGGPLLLTLISCVAFTTILAVVAGTLLTAATSLAHDLYQAVVMRGRAPDGSEVIVARSAVVVIGLAATLLAMYAQGLNISVLLGLPFAIAASAVVPALLYNLYWRGFTTRGALWAVYGGLLSAVALVVFSPAVSGNPAALLPGSDFAVFPLRNPGVVSIPLGFLLGWLGSVLDPQGPSQAQFKEIERSITAGTRTG